MCLMYIDILLLWVHYYAYAIIQFAPMRISINLFKVDVAAHVNKRYFFKCCPCMCPVCERVCERVCVFVCPNMSRRQEGLFRGIFARIPSISFPKEF